MLTQNSDAEQVQHNQARCDEQNAETRQCLVRSGLSRPGSKGRGNEVVSGLGVVPLLTSGRLQTCSDHMPGMEDTCLVWLKHAATVSQV